MKISFKQSILSILTLLMLVVGLTGVMPVSAAASLTQYLNPDGTLNLNSGYKGSLDIRNYSVSMDPKRGPIFRPQMAASVWTGLGTGLNNTVHAIAIIDTDVIVGGDFTNAGGDVNADYIAKWDGASWSALDSTPLNNVVRAIAIDDTDVIAGGSFTNAGSDGDADYIARWDETDGWSALSEEPLTGSVYAVGISGTDIYVGGWYLGAGSNADYIVKWDGEEWSALGAGLNSGVHAIAIDGADVYAGGWFTNAGGNANADYIAKWNGVSWAALGTTPLSEYVYAIAIMDTDVYAGGSFVNAGGIAAADYIAKWNGVSWSALGTPLSSTVNTIFINNTDVYAGGWFINAGTNANADYIAKWNGTTWSALGTAPLNTVVNAIAISGADVFAGGEFTNAGGNVNADYIVVAKPSVTIKLYSNGAQDGFVLESTETSKLGGSFNSTTTIFKVGDNAGKKQYRGILSFSTGASIPDNATIASVILKIKKQDVVGGGDPVAILKGFRIDLKNGAFGASGLEITDFQAAPDHFIDPGKPTISKDVYSLNLSNGKASINKFALYSGLTQIRLRFSMDDNNDAIANYLNLYSGNAAAADRPQLVITYTLP